MAGGRRKTKYMRMQKKNRETHPVLSFSNAFNLCAAETSAKLRSVSFLPVGTGENQAFALLNLFVRRETFLEAAFLWIVPLAAACISFFSAR